MKKLEKLNAKRIAKIESILGGAGIYIDSLNDGMDRMAPTTTHNPTKGQLAEHYTCDHTPDTSC